MTKARVTTTGQNDRQNGRRTDIENYNIDYDMRFFLVEYLFINVKGPKRSKNAFKVTFWARSRLILR